MEKCRGCLVEPHFDRNSRLWPTNGNRSLNARFAVRLQDSAALVHRLLFSTAALVILDPVHELVNDSWPRGFFVPESHSLIREGELGKLQGLVPHVLSDALLVFGSEKLRPPLQPWGIWACPLDGGDGRAEEKFPESNGLV